MADPAVVAVPLGGADPFEVEYVGGVGRVVRSALMQCWQVRFEDCRPSRAFPVYRGQKNFTGWWWTATTGTHVGYESWLERAALIELDFDPDVVGVLTDTRCGLVLVDEVHNISLATRSGAEVSDTLKYFSERIPATFVYAGVNVEEEGLLSGTRGGQIAGRFTLIPTSPFPYGTEWQRLVAQLEDSLCLLDHRPETLTGLGRFLHTRTGGMIGSLLLQVRGAALDAVLSGTEKLTRAGLEKIPLDHTAQQHATVTRPGNSRR